MPGRYEGEDTGVVWGTKVTYLTTEERQAFVLTVRDGLFLAADGTPFTSTDKDGAIYVMDADGVFYASNEREPGEFHHSSFLAGAAVAAAGELIIEAGELRKITDVSGHYEPEQVYTAQALCELRHLGVELNGVPLKRVAVGEVDAGEILAEQTCPR